MVKYWHVMPEKSEIRQMFTYYRNTRIGIFRIRTVGSKRIAVGAEVFAVDADYIDQMVGAMFEALRPSMRFTR
jgi:hypothetical protein